MFTRVLSKHKASPAPVCWQQPLQALCSQPCPVSRGCPVWRGLKLEGWGSVRNLGSRREGGCCPGVDVSVAQQSHTSESLSPPQADMWSTCLKQGKKKKSGRNGHLCESPPPGGGGSQNRGSQDSGFSPQRAALEAPGGSRTEHKDGLWPERQ